MSRARTAPPPLRAAMITLEGVSKVYRTRSGRRTVLDNVNVTFEAGYNFGVLGVNGAGKSTLLRLIAGSEIPDFGVVRRYAGCHFRLASAARFTVPCPAGRTSRLS